MIEPIRIGILAVDGAADDIEEDYIDDKAENEVGKHFWRFACIYPLSFPSCDTNTTNVLSAASK